MFSSKSVRVRLFVPIALLFLAVGSLAWKGNAVLASLKDTIFRSAQTDPLTKAGSDSAEKNPTVLNEASLGGPYSDFAPTQPFVATTLFNNILPGDIPSNSFVPNVGPVTGGVNPAFNGMFRAAMPFVPTASGTARIVSVWTQCVSNGNACLGAGDATIQFQGDNNGQPNGITLGSTSFSSPVSTGASPGCSAVQGNPVLTAGTKYWAVMSSNQWAVWLKQPGSPVDTNKFSKDGGPWTNDTVANLSLRIEDDPTCSALAQANPVPPNPVGDIIVAPGQSNADTITIQSVGTASLIITGANFTGVDTAPFTLLQTPTSPPQLVQPYSFPKIIGFGATTFLYVACTGPATEGIYSSTLNVTTNSPTQPTMSWPVRCIVDSTPPTIYFNATPDGTNGWFKTKPAPIGVNTTDLPAGGLVKNITCTLNGSPLLNVSAGATTANINVEGTNTLSCTATDLANNVGGPTSLTVKVDSVAPAIAGSVSPPPTAQGWNSTDVTVGFSCSDAAPSSGLATNSIVTPVSSTAETAGSNVLSSGSCVDNAGNSAAQGSVLVKIDKTAPVITPAISPLPNAAGWNNSDVTVDFSCADVGAVQSGVLTNTLTNASVTANTPFAGTSVSNGGTCTDAAANSAIQASATVKLDKTLPTASIISAPPAFTANRSASFTFSGSDTLSGVSGLECSLDNASFAPCSSPADYINLSVGNHDFKVRSVDIAGNTGSPVNAVWTILGPPTIAKAFGTSSIPAGGNTTVTLTLSNPNATNLTGASFSDNLVGMSAAGGPVTGTCVGTTPSSILAGATSLSFGGITIPPAGCTVIFDITSSTGGNRTNTTSGVATAETPVAGNVSNTATLTVVAPPVIAKAFTPTFISPGGNSTLTFTITNPAANTVPLTGVSFTDNFPAGMLVAATPALSVNNCGGGSVTGATNGSNTVSLASATVAVGTPCTISVDVTAATGGLNSVQVSSTNGGTGNTATATLSTCVAPPANMLAWYSGDNTPRDIAGGNDGTLTGGVTYAAGKVGQSFNFNGTNSVTVGSPTPLKLTNSVTVDAWVRPTALPGAGQLMGVATKWVQNFGVGNNTDSFALWLQNNGGTLQVFSGVHLASGAEPILTGGTVPLNTWSHVAMTYSHTTGVFTIYVNGVSVGTTTNAPQGIIGKDSPIAIGREQSGQTRFFTGQIDEVEIFDRALTQPEIQSIFNADAGGKCKPSDLRVSKTHTGDFGQGATHTYTVTAINDGPATTSGTTTMTDTLPAGLTPTGATGTGWNCNVAAPTVTCTSTDAIPAGGTFPPITLTVSVGLNSPLSLTNTATVSGGGEMDISDDSASDPTIVIPQTEVVISGGNVTITDTLGGTSTDNIVISCTTAPDTVVFSDPANGLSQSILLSAITGSITINTNGGNDTLTLDLTGCSFIPLGGVFFNGGGQSGSPGDKLNIIGGSTTTQTFNFTNEHDGNVVLAGERSGTINYTGLEPVSSTITAANVILNYSTTTETITVSQDAGTPAQTLVDSNVGGESVSFVNPTSSLQINGGDTGDDTINVNGFGTSGGGFTAGLAINGGTGNDTVNLNADINFASGNSLDVDLQNDLLPALTSPGSDRIVFGAGANLILTGSGTASLAASRDIVFQNGSSVVTQHGNLSVMANQQTSPSSGHFYGVYMINGRIQATGTGIVTVAGRGGNASADEVGITMEQGSVISGGTTGTTTVTGTGGTATGNVNHGLQVIGAGTIITSAGSNVTVTGTGGGGSGASSSNRGVYVNNGGTISAGSSGTVTVTGTGGNSDTGGFNYGVRLNAANSTITSSGGNVAVTGTGGTSTVSNNDGVVLATGTQITAGGNGTVSVTGNAGPAFSIGLFVGGGSITSGGGNITANGTGFGEAGIGVLMSTSGSIAGVGAASVTVTGDSGTDPISDWGLRIQQGASITSVNGNIGINAKNPVTSPHRAFSLSTVGGIGAKVETTGNGSITVTSNTIEIDTVVPGVTMSAGANSVNLRQRTNNTPIDLGANDTVPTTLQLSDAELDRITAGTVTIGDANSGAIAVTGIISPLNYKTLSAQKGVAFTSTGGFDSEVTSLAVFEKMQAAGAVTIDAAATLTATAIGGFVPVNGNSFTMIENTTGTGTTGTFAGKPEGSSLTLGGVSSFITYVGGTGSNDVIIGVDTAAPKVTSTVPTAAATGVPTNSNITINFNEKVNIGAGGITLTCGGVQTFAPTLPQNGVTSIVVDPTNVLPAGLVCTVTGVSANVTDLAGNQLDGDGNGTAGPNFALTFTTLCTNPTVVTTNADSGAGSLRDSVLNACPGSTVTFAPAVTAISLTSGQIVIDKNLIIQGPGANLLTVQNTAAPNADSRVFQVNSGVTATISGLTITGGNPTDLGGGVYNLGSLTLAQSRVVGNTAVRGGGIRNNGDLTVIESLISNNTGTYASGGGGGIGNFGPALTVINSTISGNQVPNGNNNGGGIRSDNNSVVTITGSTITDNDAAGAASGGGIYRATGTVTVRGSIIAANRNNSTIPDVGGAFTSQGYNLIGNVGTATGFTNGVNNDQVGSIASPLNPQLAPLANNGGPTQTHALCTSAGVPDASCGAISPAIDKGKDFALTGFDQRGSGPNFVRPFDIGPIANAAGGDGSDIGAFELNNTPPTITPVVGALATAERRCRIRRSRRFRDLETPPGSLTVTVNGGSTATANGVTVSNIVNTNGTITANIVADCTATPATFTLEVTDGGGLTTSTPFTVGIISNTPPAVTYNLPAPIVFGQSTTVSPATAADNGSITGFLRSKASCRR